jgi:hypothetical protein
MRPRARRHFRTGPGKAAHQPPHIRAPTSARLHFALGLDRRPAIIDGADSIRRTEEALMRILACFHLVFVLLAVLAAASAWAAEAKTAAGPAPGRCVIKIGGAAVDALGWAIVTPDKPTPQETFAANDLAAHLEMMTGQRPPVVVESAVKDQKPIVVGKCTKALAKLGVDVDFDKLGIEGIAIETKGPALVLAGNKRGVLYAVYTFLEDQCGCRWFTADCPSVPQEGTIEVGALKIRYQPPLEYRATDYPCSRDADWAVRNKINGTQTALDEARGAKVSYSHFVHTFNDILNPANEFDKHPEYFSEVKGKRVSGNTQLCLTNPEVLAIAIKTVRRWIQEAPQATIFSVSQNDWHNFCECKNCKALADREGSRAGPLIAFVNAIADDVAKDYPDRIIDTLAYQWSRKPPKTVRPRPNVCVRLCSIECCFSHPLDACDADKTFVDDIKGWNKLCDRLYIWDYVINYAHSIMPFPNLRVIKPNIRFFVANGVKGIYEEACYFTKGSELAELRTYVMAKTLWNPDCDAEKAVDEFLKGYYGPAAAHLRKYIDLVHNQVADHKDWHVRIYDGPGQPQLRAEVMAEASRLFDEAQALVSADPALLARVETARLPVLYVQIMQAKPGAADAAANLASFERIARQAGVTVVREDWNAGKLETWLKAQRDRLKIEPPKPPEAPAAK